MLMGSIVGLPALSDYFCVSKRSLAKKTMGRLGVRCLFHESNWSSLSDFLTYYYLFTFDLEVAEPKLIAFFTACVLTLGTYLVIDEFMSPFQGGPLPPLGRSASRRADGPQVVHYHQAAGPRHGV